MSLIRFRTSNISAKIKRRVTAAKKREEKKNENIVKLGVETSSWHKARGERVCVRDICKTLKNLKEVSNSITLTVI